MSAAPHVLPIFLCACLASVAMVIQGCGGGGGGPATTMTTSTITTSTLTTTLNGYDGDSPLFMLEDTGLKGMGYEPLYVPQQKCISEQVADNDCTKIPNDDVYADWGESIWGATGRNDIATLQTLGVNGIRMYGNDPRMSKEKFFDHLWYHGIKAITSLSNYPYSQSKTACFNDPSMDCSSAIEQTYAQVLSTGGYAKNGFYHKSIDTVCLLNEPKWNNPSLPSSTDYVKLMVTAFDGFLTAEKKAGIKPWKNGKLPKVSVTWSDIFYCPHTVGDGPNCQYPGLGALASFYNAIHNPSGTIGYTPKNDIVKAYEDRWVNSMNLFVRADDMKAKRLDHISQYPELKDFKIYLGEWLPANPVSFTNPGFSAADLDGDLTKLMTRSGSWNNSWGPNFFKFQKPYNRIDMKDSAVGLLKLTPKHPWQTGKTVDGVGPFPINCVDWRDGTSKSFAQVIAMHYGGSLPNFTCGNSTSTEEEGAAEIIV